MSSSGTVPAKRTVPSFRSVTLSASPRISSSRCVVQSTAAPSRARSRTRRPNALGSLGIEVVGRLVDEQEQRVREQRPGDGEPLLHPVRVVAHALSSRVLEPDLGERLVGSSHSGPARLSVQPGEERRGSRDPRYEDRTSGRRTGRGRPVVSASPISRVGSCPATRTCPKSARRAPRGCAPASSFRRRWGRARRGSPRAEPEGDTLERPRLSEVPGHVLDLDEGALHAHRRLTGQRGLVVPLLDQRLDSHVVRPRLLGSRAHDVIAGVDARRHSTAFPCEPPPQDGIPYGKEQSSGSSRPHPVVLVAQCDRAVRGASRTGATGRPSSRREGGAPARCSPYVPDVRSHGTRGRHRSIRAHSARPVGAPPPRDRRSRLRSAPRACAPAAAPAASAPSGGHSCGSSDRDPGGRTTTATTPRSASSSTREQVSAGSRRQWMIRARGSMR